MTFWRSSNGAVDLNVVVDVDVHVAPETYHHPVSQPYLYIVA